MPPLHLYARVRLLYHFIAHETAGAARIRLSLRPLVSRGLAIDGKASGAWRRENREGVFVVARECLTNRLYACRPCERRDP